MGRVSQFETGYRSVLSEHFEQIKWWRPHRIFQQIPVGEDPLQDPLLKNKPEEALARIERKVQID
jgi:hypothetical protein